MNFLIDTHILLWWLADDPSLSDKARLLIENPDHLIFVSAATVWEISIKRAIGKLQAPAALEEILGQNNFQSLPITLTHARLAGGLPSHHADPFDRMLVAQAQHEGLKLLTHDRRLQPYGRFVSII